MSICKVVAFLLIPLLLLSHTKASDDLYQILGITKSTTPNEIKKAYRKLSIKHHPDHGGDKQKFIKISKAYNTLMDEEKRKIYDKYGEKRLEEYEKNERFRGKKKDHIYSDFGSEHDTKRGEDLEIELQLTLEQMFLGHSFELKAKLSEICPKCFGLGSESEDHIQKCTKCKGAGTVPVYLQYGPGFVIKSEKKCDHCLGKGQIIKKKCKRCNARKVVVSGKTLSFSVKPGVKPTDKITLENQADESVSRHSGHIIFVVSEMPHKRFKRVGNDLHFEQTISLTQALLGFDMTIDSLAGDKIRIRRKDVTKPGLVDQIKGKGMPIRKTSGRGDAFVKFVVAFPETLSADQKKGVERLNIDH